MTDIDTAALRREHFQSPHGDCHKCGDLYVLPCDAWRLCDEVDRLRAELADALAQYAELERAEMAREEMREKAEYDRDCAREAGKVYQRRAEEAEAALARVEALCDARTPEGQCLYGEDGEPCESHCDCSWGELWHESVRAALAGDAPPAQLRAESEDPR